MRVYATKPSESRPVALRKLDLGAAGAAALFPGPAWPSLPRCATESWCSKLWTLGLFQYSPKCCTALLFPRPSWPSLPGCATGSPALQALRHKLFDTARLLKAGPARHRALGAGRDLGLTSRCRDHAA